MFWTRKSPPDRRTSRADRGRSPPARRSIVEMLEGRCLLATFHWVNNADGDFNVAGNWLNQANQAGVPGPNDDATIGFSGINVGVNSGDAIQVNSLSSNAAL